MKRLPVKEGNFWMDHFHGGGSHPYFGVWEIKGNEFELICATVYRKGAEEVLRRLTETNISKKGGDENEGGKERSTEFANLE
jgi:hypothetical protein